MTLLRVRSDYCRQGPSQ